MTGKIFNLDVEYILTAGPDVTQNSQIQFNGLMKIFAQLMILLSKLASKGPQADAHAKPKGMAEAEYMAGEPYNLFLETRGV